MEKGQDLKLFKTFPALFKALGSGVRDFFRDGGVMLASYLSYAFMMAIVPFCLFVAAAFGYLLGENEQFYRFLAERLSALFPRVTTEITGELRNLMVYRGLGKVSLVIYGILSFQLFAALQSSIDMVFKVTRKSTLFRSFFFSLVIVTMIVVLLLVAFVFSSIIPIIKALRQLLPWFEMGEGVILLIKFIAPFFLTLSVAVTLYVLLPRKKISLASAFYGALFTSVMSELAKHGFTWYVGSVVNFGTIYGSLTAFVVFLLWVFYSSAIFLIGGEITNNMEARR